jgi:hypothetical protein
MLRPDGAMVIKNWPLGLDLCGYGMGTMQVACSVNKMDLKTN